MCKKKYDVQISRVSCVFSDYVSDAQAEELRSFLQSQGIADVKICNQDTELCEDFFKIPGWDFCVTDISRICLEARERGIPSLLYLHDANKNDPMNGIPYATTQLEDIDVAYLKDVYKRFFYIPWTILETKRCLVREMTEDDVDELYEIYKDPDISLYTENLYEDPDQERAYIKDYIEHVYRLCGLGVWLIVQKDTGKIIGRAGLSFREGYSTPELGYVIGKEYQRKGYGFEVCDAILKYCRDLKFPLIRVIYQEENVASQMLCEKLGFSTDDTCVENGKTMVHGKRILD